MAMFSSDPILLFGLPNGPELIVTLLIVVLLFGGKKIPELAKGLGKGIREFNEAKDGIKSEIEAGMTEKEKLNAPNNSTKA